MNPRGVLLRIISLSFFLRLVKREIKKKLQSGILGKNFKNFARKMCVKKLIE